MYIEYQESYQNFLYKNWNRDKAIASTYMVETYALRNYITHIFIKWGSSDDLYFWWYINVICWCITVLWCFGIFLWCLAFCKSGEKYSLYFHNKHIFRKIIMYAIDHAKGHQFLLKSYILCFDYIWYSCYFWPPSLYFFVCGYCATYNEMIQITYKLR